MKKEIGTPHVAKHEKRSIDGKQPRRSVSRLTRLTERVHSQASRPLCQRPHQHAPDLPRPQHAARRLVHVVDLDKFPRGALIGKARRQLVPRINLLVDRWTVCCAVLWVRHVPRAAIDRSVEFEGVGVDSDADV